MEKFHWLFLNFFFLSSSQSLRIALEKQRQFIQDTGRIFQRVGGIWVQWCKREEWQGAASCSEVGREYKASVGDVK